MARKAGQTNEQWTTWNKGRALEKGDALLVVLTPRSGVSQDRVGIVSSIAANGSEVYLDVEGVKMLWVFHEGEDAPRGWITSKQPPNWHARLIWKSDKKLHPRG